MDIQPVNNGHVLVVPRAHYESLLDVPEEIGLHLFRVTMRLANAVRHVTGIDDLNIVVNSGAAAGQDEPHYHVHIIPRREGDGFDIPLPFNGSQMPDRTVLDAYAARIISALRDPMRDKKSQSASARDDAPASAERPVHVPVFDEAPRRRPTETQRGQTLRSERPRGEPLPGEPLRSAAQPSDTYGQVQEGAHGELVYDRRAEPGERI